ncbi:acyl-CoA thioesterase [Sporothrix curviconia]|uniref:Acyl-CoA thioesterase n=1 Tax=Sporothrix curviconia TaxID=1260050 RepID=A0ABP0D0S2_9PEZI
MSHPNRPSIFETLLAVQPLTDGGPDVFVDHNRLDHGETRPKSRDGRVFGGTTLGQSLNAAQQTIGPEFVAHCMHCTFVSARRAIAATEYHVERVKDGRRFCIRQVRAVQGRRTVFLALVNFLAGLTGSLQYAPCFPRDVPVLPAEFDDNDDNSSSESSAGHTSPSLHHSVGIRSLPDHCSSSSSSDDTPARIHQWMRARHPIADAGRHNATHLAALTCMSDTYMLAVAPHSHGIWDFASPPLSEIYDGRHRLALASATRHQPIPRPPLQFVPSETIHAVGNGQQRRRQVTSIASLDHQIHSAWASGGRALMYHTIWGVDGTLVASCMQQGLVDVEDLPDRDSRL